MNTVIIIQKGLSIYGVFSTWKAASEHFSKFVSTITVEDMKHLAATYQFENVNGDLYSFSQFKVLKSYK